MFSLLPWEFKKSIEVHANTERSDFAGGPGGGSPPVNAGGVRGGRQPPPDVQKKTFFVTKRVAVGAFGAFPLRIAIIFQAGADFEVKSGVDSYF